MNTRINNRRELPRRRGSALLLSLVAVTSVVVLSASFMQFASALASRQAHAVNRKRAFYLAEAGLAEGYAGLCCSKTGNVGTPEQPAVLGKGVFWTVATELESGAVKLESTGMIGTGRAVLSLVARRGVQDISALGMFSGGSVSLGIGSLVDGYDSTKGTYLSQTDREGAELGSNDNVTLTGTSLKPTKVKGDVTAGPGDAITLSGSVTVTGGQAKSRAETELPPIEVPELTLGAAQVQTSAYPLVIPAGNVGYQSLTVGSGSQAIIRGPAKVVLGSLTLQSSAELVFDTAQGAIELYVTDALNVATLALLTNPSKHPENVQILVPGQTAQPVALRGKGPFHGVIYAPEANVVLGSTFELFGALVTDSLTLEGAAKLHFDRNLAKLAAESALPKLISWRIVELSNISSDLSVDPFDLLGVDADLLPAPAKAHADQALLIDYYDFSDVYHRYDGLESHFDWTVVKSVIFATRDAQEVLFPRATKYKQGTAKVPSQLPVIDLPML